MKIETKYNIGDTLYFLENNKVVTHEVLGVQITIDSYDNITTVCNYKQYPITAMGANPPIPVNEKYAFLTKEELLESL